MRIGIDAAGAAGPTDRDGPLPPQPAARLERERRGHLLAYFNGRAARASSASRGPRLIRALRRRRGGRPALAGEPACPQPRAGTASTSSSPRPTSCPLSLDVPRVTTVHDVSFFSVPEDFSLFDGARRRAAGRGQPSRLARDRGGLRLHPARDPRRFSRSLAARVVHVPHGPDDDLPRPPPRDEARARLGCEGPLLLSVGLDLQPPLPSRAAARRRQPGEALARRDPRRGR